MASWRDSSICRRPHATDNPARRYANRIELEIQRRGERLHKTYSIE